MNIFSHGKICALNDLKPGDLFAFRRLDLHALAIKCSHNENFAILWSRDATTHQPAGPPAVAKRAVALNLPLCAFPEAQVTAPVALEHMRERSSFSDSVKDAGSLFVSEDGQYAAAVLAGDDMAFVNLATGDLSLQRPERSFWFQQWSIIVPTPNGYETLCSAGTLLQP